MAYLLPFLTVLIWGGNAIVNKIAASTIEPSAMSFYRWALAMLVMTPFCLPKLKRYWPEIRRNSGKLAFLALLGMVLNQSLGYYAALTTSASNMALITSLVPLISVFMSVPLLGKKISMLSIAGGVISLAGLAFMLGQGDVAFFMHQTVAQGDLLMVLAAFVYATYCVLLKRWKMQLSSWMLIYTQGVFAVIMLFPLLLTSETIMPTSASLPLIAYAGLLASLIAPLCWVKAIDLIGADNSAMFMNLLPVIAVALAAALLGETITQFHVIGGLMVISGVILSQVKVRRRKLATDTVEQNLTIDKQ
ncbi:MULTISPECIES: DMT family transporter [Vibrio]|uniref:DMT family transporter n=1 Tax=Vibrio mediterranei TaxID=689 RepID=A0A3G4VL18_9VIBR|nr:MULTISPECIES: DMT family transporter [Vibrio]AYV24302.1 DMT family transporter [Vibrio mediterranei]MCF4172899.1 DMT family transporter [Vibrio sp. McD22-P3]